MIKYVPYKIVCFTVNEIVLSPSALSGRGRDHSLSENHGISGQSSRHGHPKPEIDGAPQLYIVMHGHQAPRRGPTGPHIFLPRGTHTATHARERRDTPTGGEVVRGGIRRGVGKNH